MPRNTELVRQWEILREIDAARTGIPIAKLASTRKVHVRTIRRDIDALSRAGFPLYDDRITVAQAGGRDHRGARCGAGALPAEAQLKMEALSAARGNIWILRTVSARPVIALRGLAEQA